MIKILVSILVVFISIDISIGQQICDEVYRIGCYYEEICLGDTIYSEEKISIPLNCNGDLKVVEFYPNGAILAEKYYTGMKFSDTLRFVDSETFEVVAKNISYFRRNVPKGIWIYYHLDGSIWKKVNFD